MKNDLISRQAAIDTLKNRWKKTRHYEGIGDDIAEECELYLKQVPSAQPSVSKEEMVGDTISRQAAIKAICEDGTMLERQGKYTMTMAERKQRDVDILDTLPPAQHTALTADDIETIRIHLSAFKEELCNQGRWTEAAEYERLIQRLIGKGGHDGKG